MVAFGNISNETVSGGGVFGVIPVGNIIDNSALTGAPLVDPPGISAADAIHINFILANVDAITSIYTTSGDPSTPSTLLPFNSALGNLDADITAQGLGNEAEGIAYAPEGDPSANGISGGPIGGGSAGSLRQFGCCSPGHSRTWRECRWKCYRRG